MKLARYRLLDNSGYELIFGEDMSSNTVNNMLPTFSLTITYIMNILETEKLILRNITEDDFDDLFRMNSDPLMMKYVGEDPRGVTNK